jgi:integrase
MRLIHDRRTKSVALPGCRLYQNEWDEGEQRLVFPRNNPSRKKELTYIKTIIDDELDMMNRYVIQLRGKRYYTVDDLLRLYRERKDDSTLLGFTENLIMRMKNGMRPRTARAYMTAVRTLIRYNKGADIPLEHINPALLKGFESSLKEEGKLPNTIAHYMRNLRSIYNKAVESNRILDYKGEKPFAGISTASAKTVKRALPLENLQALYSLNLGKLLPVTGRVSKSQQQRNMALRRSWYYFFFCLFARGMSWVDLAHLRKENIRDDMIRYCRKKTGQQIEISLTPELKEIINQFADEVAESPYVFPIISNDGYETALRVQNNRLKRLAKLAGIKRNVTTHVARHSWASVGKDENLSIRVISEGLGHTSQETTLIYLTLLNNQALDEANERVEQAIKRSYKML